MANKIKKGDEVIVIAGKDKGRQGSVVQVYASGRVKVEGVNFISKHVRPNPNLDIKGGIDKREAPINASNVALYNPITKKADRVGFKILENGRKVRYYKSNNEIVDTEKV